MSVFYIHFSWFFMFILVSFIFFILSLYITLSSTSFFFSIDMFSSWFMKLTVSFSIDMFSSWFSFVVTFISSVIMIYSYFYMSPYSKPNYFIWLTFFFVVSMLLIINMTNFLFIMLGWDGLGLISFFLIVYYQNFSSIYSGMFTVIMNRVGDCLFIISISLMAIFYSDYWVVHATFPLLSLFMLITFMTKSAIFPFSPWLPLAMAAPTPISALVHSSTLVTAGLYLSMRFSFLFYSNSSLMTFFLILSVFTSFYAGMNSIFETDMKKLIALSTLSHLGFIGLAFSCGLLYLSFFHLLVHALFKSVLFMAMGDIMTNLFHSQDIRFLSSGFFYTPSSFFTMLVSLFNLLGLPTMSGYFSKDLVLETCNFSNSSQILLFMVFFNLIFTYYYTYKLFYYSFSTLKFSSYILTSNPTIFHTLLLTLLSVFSIIFGYMWISCIIPFIIHVSVPLVFKLLPYLLNLFIFVYLVMNLSLFKSNLQNIHYYFSNMMMLSCLMLTLMSNLYLKTSLFLCKSSEFGFMGYFLNNSPVQSASFFSLHIFNMIYLNSLSIILFSLSSIFFLFLLLLYNMMNYMQLLLVKFLLLNTTVLFFVCFYFTMIHFNES